MLVLKDIWQAVRWEIDKDVSIYYEGVSQICFYLCFLRNILIFLLKQEHNVFSNWFVYLTVEVIKN